MGQFGRLVQEIGCRGGLCRAEVSVSVGGCGPVLFCRVIPCEVRALRLVSCRVSV